jgi:hypothetical protein
MLMKAMTKNMAARSPHTFDLNLPEELQSLSIRVGQMPTGRYHVKLFFLGLPFPFFLEWLTNSISKHAVFD